VNTLIGSDRDEIRWIGSGRHETLYLLTTTAGNGFLCRLGDMVTRIKAGKEFMTVPEGAVVRPAQPIWDTASPPKFADKAMLAALSSDGRMVLFPLADVPTRGNGGVGVQLLALPDGITLASAAVSDGKSVVIVGERRGKIVEEVLQGDLLAQHLGKRAQRGRVVDVRFKVSHLKGTGT
jgi:topoisomerase-4 subunit A